MTGPVYCPKGKEILPFSCHLPAGFIIPSKTCTQGRDGLKGRKVGTQQIEILRLPPVSLAQGCLWPRVGTFPWSGACSFQTPIKRVDLPALQSKWGDLRGQGEVAAWLVPRWAKTQPEEVPGHCADPLRALPLCLFPGKRDTKASLWHGEKLEKHSGNWHANKHSKYFTLFRKFPSLGPIKTPIRRGAMMGRGQLVLQPVSPCKGLFLFHVPVWPGTGKLNKN